MSKIEEIRKIKEQLKETLGNTDIPNNKTLQEVFYELYDNWVKMKGEWEKEQERKRRELEEKYKKEADEEREEVERACGEVEDAIKREVESLSKEVKKSSGELYVLKSAYKKAYELNPKLSASADEDKQTLDGIDESIAMQRNFLKGLEDILSKTETSVTSEKGEE